MRVKVPVMLLSNVTFGNGDHGKANSKKKIPKASR